MSLIETKNGRTVLKKADSMMIVPYVYDSTVKDYVLGSDVYDISSIIGDSIVLEQSEGDTTTKYNEFVGSPILECSSNSKYSFTAQCTDLQNKILKSLFGAMTVSGIEGAAAFQDDFTPIYALIRIRFRDASLPDVIFPKVRLNSKLFINQLKTRVSQGNISGTSMSRYAAIVGSGTSGTASQFSNPTTYTPFTPVLFVPRTKNFLVFHHKGVGNTDTYSSIDFSNGIVSSNISVNPLSGAWSVQTPQSGGNGSGSGGQSSFGNEE